MSRSRAPIGWGRRPAGFAAAGRSVAAAPVTNPRLRATQASAPVVGLVVAASGAARSRRARPRLTARRRLRGPRPMTTTWSRAARPPRVRAPAAHSPPAPDPRKPARRRRRARARWRLGQWTRASAPAARSVARTEPQGLRPIAIGSSPGTSGIRSRRRDEAASGPPDTPPTLPRCRMRRGTRGTATRTPGAGPSDGRWPASTQENDDRVVRP